MAAVATITERAVAAIGELTLFSMMEAAVLGGVTIAIQGKIYVVVSLSLVYSCMLGIPKHDSRSMSSLSLMRRTLRAYISSGERMGFLLSGGRLDA